MKDFLMALDRLSWTMAVCLMAVHGFLLAEYTAIFTQQIAYAYDESLYSIVHFVSRLNYGWVWVSSIVTWIVSSFLFHLSALLMDGRSDFKRFLIISAYPHLVPMVVITIGIFHTHPGQISLSPVSDIPSLLYTGSLKTIASAISLSYIIMYGLVVVLIRHTYQLSFIKSLGSVFIPVCSIWVISGLLDWIFP